MYSYTQKVNSAGVNHLCVIFSAMDKVKKALSNDFGVIENWSHENVMVLNAEKMLLHAFRKRQSK